MAAVNSGTPSVRGYVYEELDYQRLGDLQDWAEWERAVSSKRVDAVMSPSGNLAVIVHPSGFTVLGGWFEETFAACRGLRWREEDLPDERSRVTDWDAVLRLLSVLGKVLDCSCPAPALVPTESGGVQAEWHRNGVYLEIESDPDGTVAYYVSWDGGSEVEGTVTLEDLDELRGYAAFLVRPSLSVAS